MASKFTNASEAFDSLSSDGDAKVTVKLGGNVTITLIGESKATDAATKALIKENVKTEGFVKAKRTSATESGKVRNESKEFGEKKAITLYDAGTVQPASKEETPAS